MNSWFECKVKYNKLDERGKGRKVSETYLVDALTFSEAEERISREVGPYITGEFSIVGMKKTNVNEIFPNDEGDRWFRCKVIFVTVDEVKATEKRVSSTILVFGTNIDNAWQHLKISLADTVSDYEVPTITETNIMDIFPYTGAEMPPEGFKSVGESQSAPTQDANPMDSADSSTQTAE